MDNILVVGTVRNVGATLQREILNFKSALSSQFLVHFFLVESDSSDNTLEILHSISDADINFRFSTLGNIENQISDRIERIRFARNVYVAEVRNNPIYSKCAFVVVADLDGVNSRISETNFLNAFNSEASWDVLTANQLGKYYDLLALRHPIWSPNNCYTAFRWLSPLIGERKAWSVSIFQRMIRIPSSAKPIEVDSAFGGLSVNRRWVFEKCDYSRDGSSRFDDNEHVTLNSKVRQLDGKIFIQPDFINARWTSHSIHGIRFVHYSKLIADSPLLQRFKPILRPLTKLLTK
jgi:hypothetical protein